jgi:6-phosphogluconolactonase
MPNCVRSLTILVVFLSLLLAGCGSSSGTRSGFAMWCPVPSNGPCSVNSAPEFLYATSDSDGGQILVFHIDHTSGALGSFASMPGPGMASGITSAQDKFLYVSDTQNGAIDAFFIDQTSGALTDVPGSPFSPPGSSFSPLGLVAGTALYASGVTGITGFTIGSNGALTTVVGSPYSAGVDGQVALGQSNSTPINYFLYATNFSDPKGAISVFRIVYPPSGILTPVPGNFTTGELSGPAGIVFDSVFLTPFVFVALSNVNQIAAFSVDATTGALTPVPGSPFASGLQPVSLALNAGQNVLYALNFLSGTISAYSIANNGSLTPVRGSPFTVGGQPGSIITTSDNYLYASLPGSDIIEGFSISTADGGLTPLTGSPFPAVGAGLMSVVQIPPP